jgi:AAA domain
MPQYFCSLPNEKKAGRIPVLISDDPEKIAAFVKRWDVPGRGVFRCVNPLRPGATRRTIKNIEAIERLVVDIDFKDLTAAPEEIEQRLRGLPLQPTWVRRSGGGLHVGFELKEPIAADDREYFQRACDLHRRLVGAFSGDPAVAHPAALLRVEGSHNSKRGKPVRVEPLWGSDRPVDSSEVETLIELPPAEGMFERKAGSNGHDQHSPFVSESKRTTPIDVDARLRDMKFKGEGENAIHTTQVQVTAALLCTGYPLEDVVADVLEATCKAVSGDPRAAKWNWREEEFDIRRMSYDWIVKHPELSAMLPDPLRTPFEAALAKGKTAKIVFARHIGWHVRSFGNREAPDVAELPPKADTTSRSLPGWHLYDNTKIVPPRWLIKGLLPESGLMLLAGQWGTFKTSTAIDLSIAAMTGQKFADQFRVKRPGAVLYFALEGAGTLMARVAAIARQRQAPDALPFAWRDNCPQLTDRHTGPTLARYIQEADAFFQRSYGIPVVLVWFDTYIAAAGHANSGDDSDTAATQKTYNTLRYIATNTQALIGVIDHFGKVIEAGTRGSSSKEGGADAILAALADRELNGSVTNTRIAIRKQRDGLSGFEIPFTPEKTEIGFDEDGDPITALTLCWGKRRQEPGRRSKSKDVVLLCQLLTELTAKRGVATVPEPGGPSVQTVYAEDLRKAFFERRHADGTAKQKHDKRAKAYARALQAAVTSATVGLKTISDGNEIVWVRS